MFRLGLLPHAMWNATEFRFKLLVLHVWCKMASAAPHASLLATMVLQDPKFYVGVDFGTTYSGFAFSDVSDLPRTAGYESRT
jgi:hypothetical protein